MKVYISGKITGIEEEASLLFKKTEEELNLKGFIAVNPMVLPLGYPWEYYMKEGIKLLMDCDYIYMLPNWIDSKGSKIEHDLAKKLNLKIIYG